jgi:hypothetical protein
VANCTEKHDFYRNEKEGFAKGRKGDLAYLFLVEGYILSFHCSNQKPESFWSFTHGFLQRY